jgi:hypothetical protein
MDDLPTPSMHVYQRLRPHCIRCTTTGSLVTCQSSLTIPDEDYADEVASGHVGQLRTTARARARAMAPVRRC